jgi:hypothetical protein
MNSSSSQPDMNIWALPKAAELRLVLLTLDQYVDITRLKIDLARDCHRQALHLCDTHAEGLSAYLYIYGQSDNRYGLQLDYPTQLSGVVQPYDPIEELTLEQVADLLCMHFELT